MRASALGLIAASSAALLCGAPSSAQVLGAAVEAGSAPRAVLAAPSAVVLAPALLGAPLAASALTPLAPTPSASAPAALALSAPPTVLGRPGPGVLPEHVAAVQKLADATGRTWFVFGSRQTGTRHRDGSAFTAASDLDLGVIGEPEDLLEDFTRRWDGVPDVRHDPVAAVASAEDAVARGHLVIAPRRAEPAGTLGFLRRLAAPFRTTAQLSKLNAAPRAEGESFRFTVIGDAEPGRFWIWRALYNRNPGAFWTLLRRADRSGSDFIFQLGDMVSRGSLRNFLAFFRSLRDAAPATPLLTAIGNHDRRDPHGVSDSVTYRALFGGTDYTFKRGGRRFVVVDSSAGRLTRDQLDWLNAVLAHDEGAIVFTHIPPAPLGEWTNYGRKGAAGFKKGAAEFMRLMSERKVARVYMGHVHGLGVLDRGGVRYVLTGGGGSPLYPGPVKTRLHHALTVDVGPDGIVETVTPLHGAPFVLR